jgi:hypothetical protein
MIVGLESLGQGLYILVGYDQGAQVWWGGWVWLELGGAVWAVHMIQIQGVWA